MTNGYLQPCNTIRTRNIHKIQEGGREGGKERGRENKLQPEIKQWDKFFKSLPAYLLKKITCEKPKRLLK